MSIPKNIKSARTNRKQKPRFSRRKKKEQEELEMAMAGPAQGPLRPQDIPGGDIPGGWTRDGKRIPRKKGGRVRGYSSGGKVHRAGLARRRRS